MQRELRTFGRAPFATIKGFAALLVMVGMTGGPLFAGFMADIFEYFGKPAALIGWLSL